MLFITLWTYTKVKLTCQRKKMLRLSLSTSGITSVEILSIRHEDAVEEIPRSGQHAMQQKKHAVESDDSYEIATNKDTTRSDWVSLLATKFI